MATATSEIERLSTEELVAVARGGAGALVDDLDEVLFALATRDDAEPALIGLLDDPHYATDEHQFGSLVAALGSRPTLSEDLRARLYEACSDDRPYVAAAALDALRLRRDDTRWDEVATCFSSDEPLVRSACLRYLAGVQPDRGWGVALVALNDVAPIVRQTAIDVLHEDGARGGLELISRYLDDPDEHVREAARYALDQPAAGQQDPPWAGTSTRWLLSRYTYVMRELLRRGVIRTANNPIGDIAEALVAAYYGGERQRFSHRGWDVTTPDGERIEVKALRHTGRTRRNLSPVRTSDYDAVVVVEFDELFRVLGAMRFERAFVESCFPHRAHVNGRIITLTDKVRSDPRVERLPIADDLLVG